MGMRFSLRVAAWSLRYGLTQLVVLCFAALAAVAVGGVVVALLASLAARIALPLVDRDLDARFDQAIATLNQAEEEAAVATLNHAAERLESVAAELGVQLAPAEILDRPRPTQQARDVFAAISDDVLAVCRLAPAAIDLSSYPRYEVWRRYQRPRLDEAMAIVLEEDPPTWSNDPARFQDGPATDLSGQLWFQRVLVAEVAIAASEGDSQAAAQALEASWRLNQALRASPQLPAHQTATAVLELQLAALRRCRIPAGAWPARLSSLDPRRDALAAYFCRVSQTRRRAETELSARRPWLGLVAQPFARLLMVHHHDAALTAISNLESQPITTFDADGFAAQVIESVPRWNALARSTLPTDWDWWRRSVYAALAAELTEQVLEVRGLERSAALAKFGIAGTPRTSRIAGMTWVYEVDAGGVSIAVEPGVFPADGEFPLVEIVSLGPRPTRSR
jgi:hypothetical protein